MKNHTQQGTDPSSDTPTVSEVVGDGSEARRLVRVGAWTFTAWVGAGEGDEPRIKDIDLGERLGFARPRDIRKLVERLVRDGKLNDVDHRATVARWEGQVAAVPVTEFWLTEAQALKVVAKSETEIADALLDEMIRVFMLARRGLLPQQAPAVSLEAIVAAVAPLVARAIAEGLAPVVRRLDDFDARLAESSRGCLSTAQVSSIKRRLKEAARVVVASGQAKNARSARLRLEQRLRGAVKWAGTGCRLENMPLAREGDVLRELEMIERSAEDVAAALRAQRQMRLDLSPRDGSDKPN